MDFLRMIQDERADLRDFLKTIEPAQWEQPSLCEGWTVHDVATHVTAYDGMGIFQLAGGMLGNRLSIGRWNQQLIDAAKDKAPEEIYEALSRPVAGNWAIRLVGADDFLADALIHQEDIRRPLGILREIPEERLVAVLERVVAHEFSVGGRHRAKGLRLEAIDIDWSHGEGPEVCGPGEALLLALAGRRVGLDDLSGEGLKTLKARV